MQFVRKYLSVFLVCVVFNALIASAIMGWNDTRNSWSWSRGFKRLLVAFGGAGSFWTIIALLAVVALLGAGLYMMGLHNYRSNQELLGHVAIGVVIGIIMMAIGIRWVHLPRGGGYLLLGVMALVILQTAIIVAISAPRRRRVRA